MSNIKVGDKVHWKNYPQNTYTVLMVDQTRATIKNSAGRIFCEPLSMLVLIPDTVTIEVQRSTAERYAGLYPGGYSGECLDVILASRKAVKCV